MREFGADIATVPAIARSVYIECGSSYRVGGEESMRPVGETEWVVAGDPDGLIGAVVGYADLRSLDAASVLDAHLDAGRGRFRGIRQVAAWDPSPDIRGFHLEPLPHLLADPDFRRGFDLLRTRGLTFDAYIFHPQLEELIDLCTEHPDVPVVLDHLGGPLAIGSYRGRRHDGLSEWRTSMTALRACRNVVVKIGGLGMSIHHGMRWHRDGGASVEQLVEHWGDEVRFCIDVFGPDRCMFESNFPVDRASVSYETLWQAFDVMVADGSSAERSALFANTAERVYRL
jgi:predicted TIM-barrel fold metal-dependent hydrolase